MMTFNQITSVPGFRVRAHKSAYRAKTASFNVTDQRGFAQASTMTDLSEVAQ
ncbi:MAG: hypothetical protein ABJL67_08480 [Sulfitobacter sp.]